MQYNIIDLYPETMRKEFLERCDRIRVMYPEIKVLTEEELAEIKRLKELQDFKNGIKS